MDNVLSRTQIDDTLSRVGIILPSQYFASIGSVGLSGEQRLMLAVLVDAINVLQRWKAAGGARRRRDFGEAAQWVNTRGSRHPFSFDSICHALEIEPEVVRSRLHVLTVCPANAGRRPTIGRLRLKELSRGQHVTANRRRRRERVHCMVTAGVESSFRRTNALRSAYETIQDVTAD